MVAHNKLLATDSSNCHFFAKKPAKKRQFNSPLSKTLRVQMSYAIISEEGKHLGFLLLAGDEDQGDCIFRSLPSKSERFDSVDSELLFNLQNVGEFQYRASPDGVLIGYSSMHEPIALNGNDLNIGPNVLKVVKLENS